MVDVRHVQNEIAHGMLSFFFIFLMVYVIFIPVYVDLMVNVQNGMVLSKRKF